MASGLLSLKWNNHRSTFFHVLSTIRSKESYCDVTIACDGKFYPVHKLVLSTCSDYFEQMFDRTNCKHPIIVLKDIRSQELEALLNYMYVGEVNVLQNDLAGLIKAAECLMIKGLAVPDEAPSKENKRTYSGREDSPLSKRRKRDEEIRPSHNQQTHHHHHHHQHREAVREHPPPPLNTQSSQRQSASASIPNPSPAVPRATPNPISPSPSVGSASESVSEDCSQALGDVKEQQPGLPNAQESSSHQAVEQPSSQSQQSVPEVILEDEPGVKEEPQEVEEEILETKEIFDSHDFEHHGGEGDSLSDTGPGGGGGGPTAFDPQLLGSQPQSMEELVAQAIPGSSGLQGNNVPLWEGEGSFPLEGFTGDGSRPPQMGVDMCNPARHKQQQQQQQQQEDLLRTTLPNIVLPPPSGFPLMRLIPKITSQEGNRREYVCQVCGYQAISESKLTIHFRKHTGEKPFVCSYCSYRCAHKSNLITHMKTRHADQEQHQ